MNNIDFAAAVRLYRETREISSREAAQQIEISHATVTRVERGQVCSIEVFEKLCRWARLNPMRFLEEAITPPKTESVKWKRNRKSYGGTYKNG
jgi:ribosome-binding protein aMBF1 (putative translation factor)